MVVLVRKSQGLRRRGIVCSIFRNTIRGDRRLKNLLSFRQCRRLMISRCHHLHRLSRRSQTQRQVLVKGHTRCQTLTSPRHRPTQYQSSPPHHHQQPQPNSHVVKVHFQSSLTPKPSHLEPSHLHRCHDQSQEHSSTPTRLNRRIPQSTFTSLATHRNLCLAIHRDSHNHNLTAWA